MSRELVGLTLLEEGDRQKMIAEHTGDALELLHKILWRPLLELLVD